MRGTLAPQHDAGSPGADLPSVRIGRGAAVFAVSFVLLYVVLASGLAEETEVTWAVPFGMLPLALLLGLGAAGMEAGGTPPVSRRDSLFGLSLAVALFAILRLLKIL
jgi:hypothetical protein